MKNMIGRISPRATSLMEKLQKYMKPLSIHKNKRKRRRPLFLLFPLSFYSFSRLFFQALFSLSPFHLSIF
ncbi:hypothetical protein ASF12_24010 [Paenibacillus sp. Leaf72]|nr:hypothetical protein ASF12_24010 [Paenibacillus sp. Leaf72]